MKAEFRPGNQVALLHSGAQYFPALIEAIDAARHEVHLETYIFASDDTGQAVLDALVRATRRGVAVRVLVDGFGAREFAQGLGAQLTLAGGEVLVYRPEIARNRWRRNRLRRLHRKLAVVDARIAFVGGINIIGDHTGLNAPAAAQPRYDYAVRIEGALVADIHAAARHLWRLVRWAELRRRPPEPAWRAPSHAPQGEVSAALVIRDNLGHRRDIEEAYLTALAGAQTEVVIANAYFLPGRRFRQALMAAARRGVRVRLLLQGHVEYALLHYATRALYGALQKSGVEIHEYRRGLLHAKVAVVDARWATVGSSNIDPFSLLLAREANIVVHDAAFARTLHASVAAVIAADAEAMRQHPTQRSLAHRATQWLAYGLVRLLISLTRYGREDYR